MFLGVDMPTVDVGDAVYPVLSSSAVADSPAENAIPVGAGIDSEGHTTGAFTAEVLSPGRIQASFFYSREDRARFMGMDSSLRMNLTDALADGLDREIIRGTNGLLTGANLADHDAGAETTYANYRDPVRLWTGGRSLRRHDQRHSHCHGFGNLRPFVGPVPQRQRRRPSSA